MIGFPVLVASITIAGLGAITSLPAWLQFAIFFAVALIVFGLLGQIASAFIRLRTSHGTTADVQAEPPSETSANVGCSQQSSPLLPDDLIPVLARSLTPSHRFSLDGTSVRLILESPDIHPRHPAEIVIDECRVIDPDGQEYTSDQSTSATGAMRLSFSSLYPSSFDAPPLHLGIYLVRWRVTLDEGERTMTMEITDQFKVGPTLVGRRRN